MRDTSLNFVPSAKVKSQIKKKLIPWHSGHEALTRNRLNHTGNTATKRGMLQETGVKCDVTYMGLDVMTHWRGLKLHPLGDQ
jgi:hypothetical protein